MPHDLAAFAAAVVPTLAIIAVGLSVGACLAFFVVDTIKQFNLGKDREP